MKRYIASLLCLVMIFGMLAGCGDTGKTDPTPQTPVTLKIVGPWEDCTAVEVIGREFNKKYPNCTVEYEYLQKFEENISTRLAENNSIDLFFTTNITGSSDLKQYVLDLKSTQGLDLSKTFKGIIDNASFNDGEADRLYAIPLGAEMRGMYVNKTLLSGLNIAVPTNQGTFLAACAKLKENGYIPLQGNPGSFAQYLLYPWVCNLVANADNYEEVHAKLEARGAGLSELFKEPFEFLYSLVENSYYDYKTVENEYGLFKDSSEEAVARDFLNIKKNGEEYAFEQGSGKVAFLAGTLSTKSIMDKTKADYHSTIEYEFIPAPIGKDGGFVYISPAKSIAANKSSANLEWIINFLNFLFTPENNQTFAAAFNAVPNTPDAFTYISNLYAVPENRISEVGKVTFNSNYFYTAIKDNLIELSKANNVNSKNDDGTSKYMVADKNGKFADKDGNKFSMHAFDYYMDKLETSLKGE
ncbi:MAG: carbohydrate ABC transporter substrate-binding protein [Clostridiales bacterium]|nr:carbohydrate ABC transporter substrate-binding protein [Clostridiales bacterium]